MLRSCIVLCGVCSRVLSFKCNSSNSGCGIIIYLQAYLEFFARKEVVDKLLEVLESDYPSVSYHVVNHTVCKLHYAFKTIRVNVTDWQTMPWYFSLAYRYTRYQRKDLSEMLPSIRICKEILKT